MNNYKHIINNEIYGMVKRKTNGRFVVSLIGIMTLVVSCSSRTVTPATTIATTIPVVVATVPMSVTTTSVAIPLDVAINYLALIRGLDRQLVDEEDSILIETGQMYCEFLDEGATFKLIIDSIENSVKSQSDGELHVKIVHAATIYLCPEYEAAAIAFGESVG